ncbi:extracellular solute-binding protein [Paenibacillus sp. GCM10023252]|uniref:sugar ABC transporter substrate-binding protein n=1 Tax=Paenibacillus sp. GCM10023252 TaxID=3252649 RepID=UPI00360EDFDA
MMRIRMMKLHTIIALFICLVLSACSNGAGNSSNQVTLTYWGSADPEYQQFVESRVSELYPNIKLKISGFPSVTGGGDAIINAAAAGTLPDLFDSNPVQGTSYSDIGITQPLSTFDDFDKLVKDLDQTIVEAGKMGDGEVHNLIIYGSNPSAVYYNKKLWKEAGLTDQDIPKTWDQLVEAAKKLTKDTNGDGQADQYGIEVATSGRGGYFNYNFGYGLYWSITGNPKEGFISEDGKQVIVDKEAYAKTIGLISELILKHKVAPPERTQDIFPTGTTAMMLNGPYMAKILDDPNKSKVVNEWGIFPFPTLGLGKATTNYMPIGGRTIMMAKNTEHSEEAWKVIKFLLSAEAQLKIYQELGELPALKSVYDSPELKEDKVAAIYNNLENTEIYTRDPYYYSAVNENLSPALDTVLAGRATPIEAVTEAVDKLKQIVAEDQVSKETMYQK